LNTEVVTAKFSIDQEVTVRSLNVIGFVDQIIVGRSYVIQYAVVYYYDGSRVNAWFYDKELTSETKACIKIGFCS